MLVIALYAALIAVILLQAARKVGASLYFRDPARLVPGEPELPPEEAARARKWAEDLIASGYALHSTHASDNPPLPDRPAPPTGWMALYDRADRTSLANILSVRTENVGAPPTWALVLNLISRLADGRVVGTSNALTDPGFPPPPGYVGVRLPGADVARLLEAHAAQLARLGTPAPLGDVVEEQLRLERETNADRLRSGVYVSLGEGRIAISSAAFAGMLLRLLNPVTGESRKAWINALLVVGIALSGVGFAHAWVGPPPGSALRLGIGFGAIVLATQLAFPRTAVVSTLLPMIAGLEAWVRPESGYAQVGALLAGGALGSFINKRRGAAPAGEHGWLVTLRLAAVACGVLAAAAVYVVLRMPREAPLPASLMIIMVVLLGGALLGGLVSMGLTLIPAVRAHLAFQVFSIASQACFPSEIAFLVAFTDNMECMGRNAESSQALITAVRAHHARTGSLPPTLDALVPTELARVPEVAVGWPGAKFDYEIAGPGSFHLSHRSASGRVQGVFSLPWGGPAPRVPIPVVPPTPPRAGPSGSGAPPAWSPEDDD